MGKIWTDIKNILQAPLTGELDVSQLFLLIGLTLVFIVAWLHILYYIKNATQEVV